MSCWQNGVASSSLGATEGGGHSLLNPPSVASLLDISLPGPPEEVPGEAQTHISDSIIELAINSAHYGACGLDAGLRSFALRGSEKQMRIFNQTLSIKHTRGVSSVQLVLIFAPPYR